jgi:hypothetical protein
MSNLHVVPLARAKAPRRDEDEDISSTKKKKTDGMNGSAISDELRDNFEDIKSITRRSQCCSSDVEAEELMRKGRILAAQTAMAIDEERRRWEQGIAELEQLLAEQEDIDIRQNSQDLKGLHIVPLLPSSDSDNEEKHDADN